MNYEEYKTIQAGLETQLEKLEADYLEEHGLAIGTPVIFFWGVVMVTMLNLLASCIT